MPPVFTVTVITARLWFSLSQGTRKEVSRPPENASRMGSWPLGVEVVMESDAECGMKAAQKFLLLARTLGGDEDRVIARNRTDDFRPLGSIHGHSDALCGADRRLEHGERHARGTDLAHEMGQGIEIAVD